MRNNMSEMDTMFAKFSKETFVANAIEKYGHLKIERVFNRAWEFGHSEGESSIKNWFMDLIDVLNC